MFSRHWRGSLTRKRRSPSFSFTTTTTRRTMVPSHPLSLTLDFDTLTDVPQCAWTRQITPWPQDGPSKALDKVAHRAKQKQRVGLFFSRFLPMTSLIVVPFGVLDFRRIPWPPGPSSKDLCNFAVARSCNAPSIAFLEQGSLIKWGLKCLLSDRGRILPEEVARESLNPSNGPS